MLFYIYVIIYLHCFSHLKQLFVSNCKFVPFNPKKDKMGTTWASSASKLIDVYLPYVAQSFRYPCAWWNILRKSRAGVAAWSPFACQMLCPRCVLGCRPVAPCHGPAHRAWHRWLCCSPSLPLAHVHQLGAVNAMETLWGSISTLHATLNALKKIQRKCKAVSLHFVLCKTCGKRSPGYWSGCN